MNENDPLGIVGKTLAQKYRVECFVAQGGFAVVYRALHKVLNKPVAIKLFNALSQITGEYRDQLERAFVNEGALLTELSSETAAIVQCRDIGTLTTDEGDWMPYLVLEWVDGVPLDQILDREHAAGAPPWTIERVFAFLGPVVAAVDVVHRHDVAHRDLKPANVLVVGDVRAPGATVKILDFGVAKMMLDNQSVQTALGATGRNVTAFTPHYGAPEQFSRRHGATGPWTDVYALALIAVEMLSGREPIQGRDVAELSMASCDPKRRPTPRARGGVVSDAVEAVFLRALAVKPEARYRRAGEFWSALEAAIAGSRAEAHDGAQGSPPASAPGRAARGGKSALVLIAGGLLLGAVAAVVTVSALGRSDGAELGARPVPEQASFDPASAAARGPATPLNAAQQRASTAGSAAPAGGCEKDMLPIPSAEFFAGSDREDAVAVERPAHQVKVEAFCIDRYEVTVRAYRACVDRGACREAPREAGYPGILRKDKVILSALCNARQAAARAEHPMNCLDFELAAAYCAAEKKRLPTEIEWEYAARGPALHRYTWGDEEPSARLVNACGDECMRWGKRVDLDLKALPYGSDGHTHTAPATAFEAGRSGFGVVQLAGNVKEWVNDWFLPYTQGTAGALGAPGPKNDRVLRGGAWSSSAEQALRYTHREGARPGTRRPDIGFRCAR
jgi:eukaryotic-like serine/threonine-protein kinase